MSSCLLLEGSTAVGWSVTMCYRLHLLAEFQLQHDCNTFVTSGLTSKNDGCVLCVFCWHLPPLSGLVVYICGFAAACFCLQDLRGREHKVLQMCNGYLPRVLDTHAILVPSVRDAFACYKAQMVRLCTKLCRQHGIDTIAEFIYNIYLLLFWISVDTMGMVCVCVCRQ